MKGLVILAGEYKSFSKKQFEYFLTVIRNNNNLGYWGDVTEVLEKETKNSYWEYVYQLSTRNKNLTILVYSSVDRRMGMTRDKGKDAVRLVYRLNHPKGVRYAKIKKHYRVESLLSNLESTLKLASSYDYIFNLAKLNLDWSAKDS